MPDEGEQQEPETIDGTPIERAPDDEAPSLTPEPEEELKDSTVPEEPDSAAPEEEGKGKVPADKGPVAPTLDAVLEKAGKFAEWQRTRQGDEPQFSASELDVLQRYNDSQVSRQNARKKQDEDYQALVKELDGAHEAAHTAVVEAVNNLFDELGTALTPSQQKLLTKEIADALTGPEGLRGKAAQIALEIPTAQERGRLYNTLVRLGLASETDARETVASLGLVKEGDRKGLLDAAFDAGVTYGRRAGPDADSVVLSKKDLEKQLADAEKKGLDSAKSAGAGRGTAAAAGAKRDTALDAGTYASRLASDNPPAEAEIDAMTARFIANPA